MPSNHILYCFSLVILLLGLGCGQPTEKANSSGISTNNFYTATPIGEVDFDSHKGDSLQRLLIEQFCEESKGYQKGTWVGLNKCSWAIEKYRLDQTPETIQRNGDELSIIIQDGKKLSFIHQNKASEKPILFQLKKYLPRLGYALIEKIDGEECAQHLFVRLRDGKQFSITGTPFLSPDKKTFILNGGSKECQSTLEYWTLSSQEIQQVWTTPIEGGPLEELRWLSEKSFVGSQRSTATDSPKKRYTRYNLL